MEKIFKDIKVGQHFLYQDKEYVRITQKKITCCKSANAALASDPSKIIMVAPLQKVTPL